MRTLSDEAGDQLVLLDRLRDTALQVTFEKHGDKVVIEMERGSWCTRTTVSTPGESHARTSPTVDGPCTPPSISVFRSISNFDPDLVVKTMHTQ
jgi:hypothetical protein